MKIVLYKLIKTELCTLIIVVLCFTIIYVCLLLKVNNKLDKVENNVMYGQRYEFLDFKSVYDRDKFQNENKLDNEYFNYSLSKLKTSIIVERSNIEHKTTGYRGQIKLFNLPLNITSLNFINNYRIGYYHSDKTGILYNDLNLMMLFNNNDSICIINNTLDKLIDPTLNVSSKILFNKIECRVIAFVFDNKNEPIIYTSKNVDSKILSYGISYRQNDDRDKFKKPKISPIYKEELVTIESIKRYITIYFMVSVFGFLMLLILYTLESKNKEINILIKLGY
ncbi:hypothetical protein [Vibrio neonatus]|uniref:hypothetical protein n=1 Tax=Vibrio neonatus TaxID=278860 RepID=UPI0021C4C3A3|nr:hypothetical protein [Vibrio neonatus]